MTNPNIEFIKRQLNHEFQVYQNILSEIHDESPESGFLSNHPAIDEAENLPENMFNSRFLIQFIEKFGALVKFNIRFAYSIVVANPDSPEAKELRKNPAVDSLHKAGKLEDVFTTFHDLINYVPGLDDYAPIGKFGESQYLEYHEKVLHFSSSRAGRLLAAAVTNAAYFKVSREFNASIQEPRFIDALCNFAINFSKVDPTEELVKIIAQSQDDGLSALAKETLDPLSKEDLKAIATKRETLRRRPKDPAKLESTNDILLTKWLPMVLWKKTAAGILEVAPELGGSSQYSGYISARKKINTSINRLGLTRFL